MLLGPGDRDPVVVAVKRRLGVTPEDDLFTDALADRVRGRQWLAGMERTGLLDEETTQLILG